MQEDEQEKRTCRTCGITDKSAAPNCLIALSNRSGFEHTFAQHYTVRLPVGSWSNSSYNCLCEEDNLTLNWVTYRDVRIFVEEKPSDETRQLWLRQLHVWFPTVSQTHIDENSV